MSVKLVRIDDRLIHGQVTSAWLQDTGANAIVIVDDRVAISALEQTALRLAAPAGVTLEIVSTTEAPASVNKLSDRRILLLVRAPQTAERLFAEIPGLAEHVNLGNLGMAPGRERLIGHVFASPDEQESLRRLAESGVGVIHQMVPSDRPQRLETLGRR